MVVVVFDFCFLISFDRLMWMLAKSMLKLLSTGGPMDGKA